MRLKQLGEELQNIDIEVYIYIYIYNIASISACRSRRDNSPIRQSSKQQE